jgi:hypothetical protein
MSKYSLIKHVCLPPAMLHVVSVVCVSFLMLSLRGLEESSVGRGVAVRMRQTVLRSEQKKSIILMNSLWFPQRWYGTCCLLEHNAIYSVESQSTFRSSISSSLSSEYRTFYAS